LTLTFASSDEAGLPSYNIQHTKSPSLLSSSHNACRNPRYV
jgi:hypothetical protein